VDWTRRFDHMQQHTGQHLLSAVWANLFDFATVSVHFGRESSTLDLDTSSLTGEEAEQAELKANEIVAENRPVEVSFETAEAASGLRKESARSGTLRIVSIRDLDRSACGGTHVRATGEVGAILVRKLERVRQTVRVEFVCGQRAVRRARADYGLVSRLAADFSSAPEELPGILESQRQEIKEAAVVRKELQAAWDLCRAKELYAATTPDATGIRRVVLRDSTEPLDALRSLGQAFVAMPMAVFVGTVASPPGVVLAASPDAGINAGGVLKGLLATVGGRGGGSPSVAQGIAPGRSQLETVVASIIS
jgi:alanyl-tRNA synthetase